MLFEEQYGVKVVFGDICDAEEDAIIVPCSPVNRPDRSGPAIGKGVDRAVYKRYLHALSGLYEEHEERKVTGSYYVRADGRNFIFTVTPPSRQSGIYQSVRRHFPDYDKYCFYSVAQCYVNSFRKAGENYNRSVAVPLLGSGGMKWDIRESVLCFISAVSDLSDGVLGCLGLSVTLYITDPGAIDYFRNYNLASESDHLKSMRKYSLKEDEYYCDDETYSVVFYAACSLAKSDKSRQESASEVVIKELKELHSDLASQFTGYEGKTLAEKSCIFRRNDISAVFGNGKDNFILTRDRLLVLCYLLEMHRKIIISQMTYAGFYVSDRENTILDNMYKYDSISQLNFWLESEGIPVIRSVSKNTYEQKEFLSRHIERYLNRLKGCGRFEKKELSMYSGITQQDIDKMQKISGECKITRDRLIALSIALRLNYNEAEELMNGLGYTISGGHPRDAVLREVLKNHIVTDISSFNHILANNGFDRTQLIQLENLKRDGRSDIGTYQDRYKESDR